MINYFLAAVALVTGLATVQNVEASGNVDDRNVAEYNLDSNGLALKGYDPVSYFPEGGSVPQEGSSEYALTYKGVRYHFANMANLETFSKRPAKYEPTYGGYCAYAMAFGQKVDILPDLFVVNGNRLHLFVSQDALEKFAANVPAFERRADTEWKKFSGENPRK